MKKQKIYFIISLFFINTIFCFSQNVDSIEKSLQTAIPDSSKLQSIIQLQKYYSYDNKNKAIQFGFKGLLLADKLKDKKNKAWVLNYIGSTYYYKIGRASCRERVCT